MLISLNVYKKLARMLYLVRTTRYKFNFLSSHFDLFIYVNDINTHKTVVFLQKNVPLYKDSLYKVGFIGSKKSTK